MFRRSVMKKLFRILETPLRLMVVVFMVTSALAVQAQPVSADDLFTEILQDGLNGYSGTRDTYILNTSPSDRSWR